MSIFDRFRRKTSPEVKSVTVPPGHKIVVVHPSPQAAFSQTESGVWIADFGSDREYERVFSIVQRRLQEAPDSSIIWVIQESVVSAVVPATPILSAWLHRFHQVKSARGVHAEQGDIAVISPSSTNAQVLMLLLASLGVGIHQPAPQDGSVFVEVHKPEGIVVGMPGPAFESDQGNALRQLYLELEHSKGLPDNAARLQEIKAREFALIEQIRQQAVGQMTLARLVTLMADEPTPENMRAFYRLLLSSKVGARIPNPSHSLRPGTGITTATDQMQIPSAKNPDGSPMLIVYCDIPGMAAAYPQDSFFEVEGRVVLEMAQRIGGGVIVQNGLDGRESWAGVPKEHIAWILSSGTSA
jgi:hypothetical protein